MAGLVLFVPGKGLPALGVLDVFRHDQVELHVFALRALAEGWPKDPAAGQMIALAVASSDPELRQAVLVGGS